MKKFYKAIIYTLCTTLGSCSFKSKNISNDFANISNLEGIVAQEAKEIQAQIKTPKEAFSFLSAFWTNQKDNLENSVDDWRSLAVTMRKGGGDCDDYVFASISLLIDDNYPPSVLVFRADHFLNSSKIQTGKEIRHGIHLLQKDGKFGLHSHGELISPKYTLEESIRNCKMANEDFLLGEYQIITFPNNSEVYTACSENLYEILSPISATSWRKISEVFPKKVSSSP